MPADPHFGYTTVEHGEHLSRQYTVDSRAWYADSVLKPKLNNVVDEVVVGHYSNRGGTTGEFIIRLTQLVQGKPPAMEVCVFDDAWHLFKYEAGLFARLAGAKKEPTIYDLERILEAEGFSDRTPTHNPYESGPAVFRTCERCGRALIPPEADPAVVYCGRRDCEAQP